MTCRFNIEAVAQERRQSLSPIPYLQHRPTLSSLLPDSNNSIAHRIPSPTTQTHFLSVQSNQQAIDMSDNKRVDSAMQVCALCMCIYQILRLQTSENTCQHATQSSPDLLLEFWDEWNCIIQKSSMMIMA